jgi:hypothetical protein
LKNIIFRIISSIDKAASSGKSYFWLAVIVFIFEFVNIMNGNWGKDFWEHAAVIRELTANPFHPGHPVLNLVKPHAFYSPYAVLLGLAGYYSGLSPFILLGFAGVLNLLLWLVAIRYFVYSLFLRDQEKISFYFLLFQLFAWGPMAWRYSSFYHITTLNYVLPYPSTISFILSLFSIGFHLRFVIRSSKYTILFIPVVILFNAVVLLTHPTTAIFLFAFLSTVTFVEFVKNRSVELLFLLAISIGIPTWLVSYWPYYPFWDLVVTESSGSQFHTDSQTFYQRLAVRLLPVWLGVGLLWKRFRKNRYDLLFLSFFGLLIIYIYGYFTKQYGYGRLISFLVMIMHLVIAAWFAKQKFLPGSGKLAISFLFFLLMLLFPFFHFGLLTKNTIPGLLPKDHKELGLLQSYLPKEVNILGDAKTILYLPAYGVKVTTSLYPAYWIGDNKQRRTDMENYFGEHQNDSLRKEILDKYKLRYIIIGKNSNTVSGAAREFSYSVGDRIFCGDAYDLLILKDQP